MPAKKKNKITRRASNPWTCFLKRTLTGKSANPNAIQEASRQYKLLETEDPGLLAELKEEAKNNKKTTVEDLNQEEKELEAQRLYKELCKTVNKLHRCGWEGMGVFYSALSNNVTTCGTPKGESFLDDNPQMLLRFGSLASSGKYGERKKESVEDLRARVRDILNNKWYLATKEKHFSYKKFLEGKVEVEGLPDGVDLKNPCDMGSTSLRAIIGSQDTIVVRPVTAEQDESLPAGQLLRSVAEGLAEAGQERAEVSLVGETAAVNPEETDTQNTQPSPTPTTGKKTGATAVNPEETDTQNTQPSPTPTTGKKTGTAKKTKAVNSKKKTQNKRRPPSKSSAAKKKKTTQQNIPGLEPDDFSSDDDRPLSKLKSNRDTPAS
ncbi:PREDICTED: uncharacterized protein LOC109462590 isoform X2 [Branchiostoma belcheri]|uniref:Uncharacterized protein LOC109462590 isoform X2 n=1 Tax=Branchiostoma belcheri TaxID=7741 RepID=A0A6P4XDT5_BRABE|nr:PREDICTED: uncharacterized protein LOC109462590 isoform X2 [Branchiostoma belcheri]